MPKNKSIEKSLKDATELRKGFFEFQGFEREFILFQQQLLNEYEKSSGLKHPVNRGNAREDYLKIFFCDNGLIPQKYGVSSSSSRVVSSTGHHSEEIDILFFDRINNISLLKYENTEFYPIEFVHGIVQVKSCFRNKKTIYDGLKNIASFKNLKSPLWGCESPTTPSSSRGFGVLFAYKSTLQWKTVIKATEEFMSEHPSYEWPNAIVILDEGIMVPFNKNKNRGFYRTVDIDKLISPNIMGIPDSCDTLLRFYSILMDMLNFSKIGDFHLSNYLRLPFPAGDLSYTFTCAPFSEIGMCEKHGQFIRKISQEALIQILKKCNGVEPINWIKAIDVAYGKPGDNNEAYNRQPGNVYIYNPDNISLSEILIFQKEPHGLAYDSIIIEGKTYWIPYIYSIRDKLVTVECPKCKISKNCNSDDKLG